MIKVTSAHILLLIFLKWGINSGIQNLGKTSKWEKLDFPHYLTTLRNNHIHVLYKVPIRMRTVIYPSVDLTNGGEISCRAIWGSLCTGVSQILTSSVNDLFRDLHLRPSRKTATILLLSARPRIRIHLYCVLGLVCLCCAEQNSGYTSLILMLLCEQFTVESSCAS